jgi:aconitate hydratase
VRPFVCARDVALELMRRGLGETVRRVEAQHRGPVVLEFAGPSVRLLSVGERSVLAGLAPQLGAAAALFTSDERTEVFLRDQRRSKAHRALLPDAGAPCDEVVNLDLAAVDPLLLDEAGAVRTVRDLAGKAVSQVLLGGDSGVTLRDLFAAAALLKSKRVPPRLDLLLAVPSRQMLETLAAAGALADLLATGARLIEPDARVMDGSLYPPPRAMYGSSQEAALSARTCDPEPTVGGTHPAPFVVASAETLSYAVATGEIGDPRAFKRPVRVTVPRALPTDDVLVVRERRAADAGVKRERPAQSAVPAALLGWKGATTLDVVDAAPFLTSPSSGMSASANPNANANANQNGKPVGVALLCATLDEVRTTATRVAGAAGAEMTQVRAVVASFIPSATVAFLSGFGVVAIEIDLAALKALREAKGARSLALPAPAQWGERESVSVSVGALKVPLTWLALGVERSWAGAGTAAPPRDAPKSSARR